jgi:perosamine synthetase
MSASEELAMIPRGRLDIGWSDLVAGAAYCLRPGRRGALQRRVERLWSDEGDALVCLSVRSGLDLLLTALAYPEGSEVLVSAITIRDMVKIIERHGLVPVPVDLDMRALTVKADSLERAVTAKTKALLVAHLFGNRMPLEETASFARDRGLLLIEDCAQSFTGLDYRGHRSSDVSMFSFGPIKTSTALGGALLRVKEAMLRDRMTALQSAYPVQGRWRFANRVGRFSVLRFMLQRLPFTILCAGCRLLGKSHDDLISHSVRGFTGPDLLANIRHQPSYPLLALLRRRLTRFDGTRMTRRVAAAQAILRSAPDLARPGREAAAHTYWTFPIHSASPDDLVRHLWLRGFDATRGQWSLYCVPAPERYPHPEATEALETMRRLVYVPAYPEVPGHDLERLGRVLRELEGAARGAGPVAA